jgi:tRNA dimethylallyltransferase
LNVGNSNLENPSTLIVVCGPTAVGKTAVGIALAQHWQTEIISTDSRQFYREMNAATGKPSPMERAQATHHFIDNLSIQDSYSAGQFEIEATKLLGELFQRHSVVLAVGGSGLYFKAITEGLDEFPSVDPKIKSDLTHIWETEGLGPLLSELRQQDPNYFAIVDHQNPRRILRALEVIRSSGKPFSAFQGENKMPKPYRVIYLRLGMDRQELYARINSRVENFVNLGLFSEAEELHPHKHLTALQTPGYKEAFDFLEGKLTRQETIDKIKQHNRNYAKRQETWLNQQVGIQAYHPEDLNGIIAGLKHLLHPEQ